MGLSGPITFCHFTKKTGDFYSRGLKWIYFLNKFLSVCTGWRLIAECFQQPLCRVTVCRFGTGPLQRTTWYRSLAAHLDRISLISKQQWICWMSSIAYTLMSIWNINGMMFRFEWCGMVVKINDRVPFLIPIEWLLFTLILFAANTWFLYTLYSISNFNSVPWNKCAPSLKFLSIHTKQMSFNREISVEAHRKN